MGLRRSGRCTPPLLLLSTERATGTLTRKTAGSAPNVTFKELWRLKEMRIKRASSLGQVAKGWRLMPIIVKAGDDLRQEQVASQFFLLANSILKKSPLGGREGLRFSRLLSFPDIFRKR